MQYGAAWWFLDHKPGMEKHLTDLAALTHIGSFIGMLTDSRSFLSYPRHHYFRRILCNFLGTLMDNGEITQDIDFVGKVVRISASITPQSIFQQVGIYIKSQKETGNGKKHPQNSVGRN